MNRYSAVIVLMVLGAGCTHAKKPESQPQPPPVASKPEGAKAPQTAKATPATGAAKAAPPAKTTSKAAPATATSKAAPPAKTVPPPATKPKPVVPPKQAAPAPTLDLDALEARLKQTKGIGVMTKLSLKNQVDDLIGAFRKHYAGKPVPTVTELRRSYDLLMMKVLSLLQDRDQQLASDILSSRERIWGLLADPKSFAALDA
jgi:hypothetical protein